MPRVVDFHCHVFPDKLEPILSRAVPPEKIQNLRRLGKSWFRPFSSSIHKSQVFMRHLPETARKRLDAIGVIAPIPGLIFESTPKDLIEAMDESGVSRAVVIAHPPMIPNEFVLDTCSADDRLIAAVNVPPGTSRPGQALKSFAHRGARVLKIHPANDGEGPESPRYRALLKAASELGMPVIIHTGLSYPLFKGPDLVRAEIFSAWFEKYSSLKFILAHMNYHEPLVAMDLAEEFENVFVDTSWQPPEAIGEAVRRIGSERILLASDWPLVGHNMSIALQRIEECVTSGLITETDAARIRGENAEKILHGASA